MFDGDVERVRSKSRAGAIGATGAAMAAHLIWPPSKKHVFKPRYVCTLDSSIHVNIVVVSAVLALDAILLTLK